MPTEKIRRKTKVDSKKHTKKTPAPKRSIGRMGVRMRDLLARRPHRSFRRTLRRDYSRSLRIPGYWSFTGYVMKMLWGHKKLFLSLTLFYTLMIGMFVGLGSQEMYAQLAGSLGQGGGDSSMGQWGQAVGLTTLLSTLLGGTLNGTLTDVQFVYSGITLLLLWLTTVWLLRSIVAGRTPRLRDGLYNSGAPIVPTFLVSMVVVFQLLPVAIAAIMIVAAIPSGVLENGALSMLIWTIALLLTVLSLYWVTSTILALVVVTLPGMYPLQAIRTAGDLVVGRRVRILLRLIWLGLSAAILWLILVVPVIIFDAWLKSLLPAIEDAPIVPLALLVVSSLIVVWIASYTYLLYRKVVDDDASPA